jgi:hypothetical protein
MPVSSTVTRSERYTFARLFIDVERGVAEAYFAHEVNGARQPEDVRFAATSADYGALLTEIPAAGRPRGYDIADAVYALALAQGVIHGEIEPDVVPPVDPPGPEPLSPVAPEGGE